MIKFLQKVSRNVYCFFGEQYEQVTINFLASDLGAWWYHLPKFKKRVAVYGFWFLLGVFVSTYGGFK